MLAQQYGFQAFPTLVAGEQLLQVRRGEEVLSECRTRPAAVLWTSSPHDSFSVELELQDPATARPIKPLAAPTTAPSAAKPAADGAVTSQAATEKPAEAAAAAKKKDPPWGSFFPRSRIPKTQVENLDSGAIYH
jgi:hypothetical protein